MKEKRLSRRKFVIVTGLATTGLALSSGGCKSQVSIAKKHELLDSVEVLVAGGGSAGIGAALGAARTGVKTMILESEGFFGGVASWSLGMQINQIRPKGIARSLIHEQLISKIAAYGDQAIRYGKHQIWCNVEFLKVAILDALEESNCKYLLHAGVVDTVVENNRIVGVVISTKQGLKEIRAKVIVDCTGDADVAYFAGAETMIDPDDLMPQTLALMLSNFDFEKLPKSEVKSKIMDCIHDSRDQYQRNPSGFVEVAQMANSNSWYVNSAGTADLGRIDITDPYNFTKAASFSQRQAVEMIQSIRGSGDSALEQIELVGTGPRVSVRESRRVKGLYVLTKDDAYKGQVFEDTIGWRSGYVDLGGQLNDIYDGKMMVHDVPYRSILPEKLDGLLTAGRCISTTHVATAAGKSMGNCIATGHAAGLAAAMSVQKKVMPRELRIADLQDALRADGVDLEVKDRVQ